MLLRWLTSAGILFESLQPLTFALAAVASTWVLANARRRGVHPYLTVAWALGAFFLPLVILPLYFAARAAAPPRETTHASPAEPDREQPTDTTAAPAVSGASATAASFDERRGTRSFAGRPAILIQSWAFPFLYAAVLCASGAAYFYLDYDSVDAGLARAERAKLTGRREAAIREYRAALRREEDAHTRKLLA
ncbi:MAG: hypothetical protein ACRD68_17340, partial [Pyrinomonadaceae bacterium]